MALDDREATALEEARTLPVALTRVMDERDRTMTAEAQEQVTRALEFFHAQVGVVAQITADLKADYGPVEDWDARTWEQHEHLVDVEAWRRAASAFGGGA